MRNFLWSQGMDGEGADSDGDNEISELTFFFSLFQATAPIGVSWRYWYEIIQNDKRKKLFLCIVCKQKYQNLLRNEWSVLASPSPLHQPGRDDAMTWPVCFVLLSCQVMTQYDMKYGVKCHNMAFVCQYFYLPFAAKAPGLWQEIQSMAEVPGKEIIWHLHH